MPDERPAAPSVGSVTHHSIDLNWEETLEQENKKHHAGRIHSDDRVQVHLEQRDQTGNWTQIYTGYSKQFTVENLKPWESYFFRIRFCGKASKINHESPWSPEVTVTTAKQPMTGEDIHSAIIRQNFSELQRILETDEAPINACNKYGNSPLMVVAEKGYTEMIETLVDHGAEVDLQNDAGKTALMLAAFAGKIEPCKELRYHGAQYNIRDKGGSTALHWALDSRNLELIEWMLDDGADISVTDFNDWTPLLRVAAVGGNADVAKLLLRHGADINGRDRDGKTALMMAVVNGHQALIELLLEKNVDVTVKNTTGGKTAYEMAIAMEKPRIVKIMEEYMTKHGIKYYH